VRELRNALERAMLLASGAVIEVEHLPAEVRTQANARGPRRTFDLPCEGIDLESVERELVIQAITQAKGNKTRAGRLLGLNRDQVRYRLAKYGLRYGLVSTETEAEQDTEQGPVAVGAVYTGPKIPDARENIPGSHATCSRTPPEGAA
jgi:hypothetical protein